MLFIAEMSFFKATAIRRYIIKVDFIYAEGRTRTGMALAGPGILRTL
jgi:hypothetical protein